MPYWYASLSVRLHLYAQLPYRIPKPDTSTRSIGVIIIFFICTVLYLVYYSILYGNLQNQISLSLFHFISVIFSPLGLITISMRKSYICCIQGRAAVCQIRIAHTFYVKKKKNWTKNCKNVIQFAVHYLRSIKEHFNSKNIIVCEMMGIYSIQCICTLTSCPCNLDFCFGIKIN